jgi:phage tail sheath protein FI
MAQSLATPGVYIEERNAFPNSVASIPTAVPAFVGYTEKTTQEGKSLICKPVRITSLGDYHKVFGRGARTSFLLAEIADPSAGFDLQVGSKYYSLNQNKKDRFILYDSIRMFFANGGGACYIVSAGAYATTVTEKSTKPAVKDGKPEASTEVVEKLNEISKKALDLGLQSLVTVEEPTMVVIPEAVMIDEGDCFALQQEMLLHSGFKMKNRPVNVIYY